MVLLPGISAGVMGFGLGTGMAAAFLKMTLQNSHTRIILMWQSVAITGGCIFRRHHRQSSEYPASRRVRDRGSVSRSEPCQENESSYFLPRCATSIRRSHACPALRVSTSKPGSGN